MNLFQPGPFQPILFQTGGATSLARSGWFRLMLAELQQESLDADKKKQQNAEGQLDAATPTVVPEQKAALVERKRRAAPVQSQSEFEEIEDGPPTVLKPMYRPRIVELPDVGPTAIGAMRDVEGWVQDFVKAATSYKFMIERLRERLEHDVAQIQKKRQRRNRALMLAMML